MKRLSWFCKLQRIFSRTRARNVVPIYRFVFCSLLVLITSQNTAAAAAQSPQVVSGGPRQQVIVFIGDSITAGYGVRKEEAFPDRLGELLNSAGLHVKVINGGISGSVTADADQRVRWFLKAKPDLLVVALGANDGLKGTPAAVIKKNLAQAIDLAKENKVRVFLIGMRIFENFGPDYTRAFTRLYADLAKEKDLAFYPFLLDGVALDGKLNQSDGKHPNAKGHEVIAMKLEPSIKKLLEQNAEKKP